jgi:hypothetical protein
MVACCGAFWLCVIVYWRRSSSVVERRRFIAALALGGAAARGGWALLHLERVARSPLELLDPAAGFSSLFVLLGPLAVGAGSATEQARTRFLGEALGVLLLGIAVARLGCLAAGCCAGIAMESPLAIAGFSFANHPVPLYDVTGLLVLHLMAARIPTRLVVPTVLVGFGCLRLFLEPLRPSSGGAMAVEIVCSAWIALGVSIGWRHGRRGERCRRDALPGRGAPRRTSASARACGRGP